MNDKKNVLGKELCPTCFRLQIKLMPIELARLIEKDGSAVLHQCDLCRELGRNVDLESLSKVLTGERLPLPKLDTPTSLSDLINDLIGNRGIKEIDLSRDNSEKKEN